MKEFMPLSWQKQNDKFCYDLGEFCTQKEWENTVYCLSDARSYKLQ